MHDQVLYCRRNKNQYPSKQYILPPYYNVHNTLGVKKLDCVTYSFFQYMQEGIIPNLQDLWPKL